MTVDSSLIFLVVIGLWLAYLVPQWLRRRQQLSASRSGDRFSGALRVLARRPEPTERGDRPVGRPYVLAPPPSPPAIKGAAAPGLVGVPAPARVGSGSDAGRARLPLLGLVVLGLLVASVLAVPGTVALAVLSLAPVWSPAGAFGALVVLLLALRTRARRRARAVRPAAAERVVEPSAVVVADEGGGVADEPADGDTRAAAEDRELLPGEWTPVPVPLPSYLLKVEVPRRRRPSVELDEVSRWHADWREQPAAQVDDDDIPTYAPPVRRALGA